MNQTKTERKVRGFQLSIERASSSYGVRLAETNGRPGGVITVARADDRRTRVVLPAVMGAVKASGHARTVLGPQRKAPIALSEEAGVRLALVLLAAGPVTKARRIDLMVGAVEGMATEETYYWYARCMGPDAARVRRALRIFLAEE